MKFTLNQHWICLHMRTVVSLIHEPHPCTATSNGEAVHTSLRPRETLPFFAKMVSMNKRRTNLSLLFLLIIVVAEVNNVSATVVRAQHVGKDQM